MATLSNPYIGPRSFLPDETLYGRDRELRQLTDRLLAERIVLLHSPSGAGKTSLVQAGLIPQLRSEGFFVHQIIRVNLEPPLDLLRGASSAAGENPFNRYTFSTLLSMEERDTEGPRLPINELAQMSLETYLKLCATHDGRLEGPEFIIFDQFEEILTIDAADRAAKNAFFTQLGAVLKNRNRWALFVMREDFVGAIEPYVLAIPTYLANTFRLDLLGVNAAREAIQKPAQHAGVDFVDEAAQKLVDDLRRILVQRPDGGMESVLGLYIEPVQLQVVCYRLWETHPEEEPAITVDNLADIGDVDQSLAEYYALSVTRATEVTGVDERSIRAWLDTKLITKEGVRGQVLMGAENSDGLANTAVRLLEDAHIIRGEKRAGAIWFELAHDRLVEPLRKNNAAWFERNLSLFQRQAALWVQQGRSDGLLLRGKDYLEAEKQAKQIKLTPSDEEYLAACKKLRSVERRERRRNQLMSILAVGMAIALAGATFFSYQAQVAADSNKKLLDTQSNIVVQLKDAIATAIVSQMKSDVLTTQAQTEARLSRSKELAALSSAQGGLWVQRQLLLAMSAYDLLQPGDPVDFQTENILRSAASQITPNTMLLGHTGAVRALVFSPNGQILASAGDDQIIRIWDFKNSAAKPLELKAHTKTVHALQFSPDGKWLASGGEDNLIYLWDPKNFSSPPKVLHNTQEDPIFALAFSPDSQTLIAGGAQKYVYVWRMNDLSGQPLGLQSHKASITGLAYATDGLHFYSLSSDGVVFKWEMEALFFNQAHGGEPFTTNADGLVVNADTVYTGTYTDFQMFSAESTTGLILGASKDGQVMLYDPLDDTYNNSIRGLSPYRYFNGNEYHAGTAAISPDGKWVVSGEENGIIRLWDAHPNYSIESSEPYIQGNAYSILTFDINPTNNQLLIGGEADTMILVDSEKRVALNKTIKTSEAHIKSVIISPNGKWAAASGDTNTSDYSYSAQQYYFSNIYLWDLAAGASPSIISQASLPSIAFSPDGKWLAYDENNETINLYDLQAHSVKITLPFEKIPLLALKFSPDSHWLLSSDWDGLIYLWDLTRPEAAPKMLAGNKSSIYSFEFSSDENWLIAGGINGEYYTWRFDNIRAHGVEPFQYSNQLCSRASDPVLIAVDDSNHLLAYACGNTIFFASMVNPQKILGTLIAPSTITEIKFSFDHKFLLGSSVNGEIYYWDMDVKVIRAKACSKLSRNFTQLEWDQFFPNEPYRVSCPQLPSGQASVPAPTAALTTP